MSGNRYTYPVYSFVNTLRKNRAIRFPFSALIIWPINLLFFDEFSIGNETTAQSFTAISFGGISVKTKYKNVHFGYLLSHSKFEKKLVTFFSGSIKFF